MAMSQAVQVSLKTLETNRNWECLKQCRVSLKILKTDMNWECLKQ